MTTEILDAIAKLLAASKASPDAGARLLYLGAARVELEAARARLTNLDGLVTAAEEEVARVAAAEKEQRPSAPSRKRQDGPGALAA